LLRFGCRTPVSALITDKAAFLPTRNC